MNKLVWYIKQLFPLTYRTRYKENGKPHFCVWRMWFGFCFNIDDVVTVEHDEHRSDCATHNMPAMPNGPCNCVAI